MADRDPAERQLWKLTGVRLLGLGLAVAGLWVVGTRLAGDASPVGGLLLMLAGAALVAFAPRLFR